MGIDTKIMDKIVVKCKKDVELKGLITELMKVEADRVPHYKDKYKKLIESYCKELESNEG